MLDTEEIEQERLVSERERLENEQEMLDTEEIEQERLVSERERLDNGQWTWSRSCWTVNMRDWTMDTEQESLHCKKRLAVLPPPAGMSLTKLSLAGNN
jgi:hypothetical protein